MSKCHIDGNHMSRFKYNKGIPIYHRLSENAEAKVRDNNDNITKVTDDSPIKIAEQFKETYDNEYTYAFDEMEEMGLNSGTETSTKLMLDILEVCVC